MLQESIYRISQTNRQQNISNARFSGDFHRNLDHMEISYGLI